MDAITPASSGSAPSTQRVEERQRAVLGLTLSPDPCLLRDGISPSWLEQKMESLPTKMGALGGGHVVLSCTQPAVQ